MQSQYVKFIQEATHNPKRSSEIQYENSEEAFGYINIDRCKANILSIRCKNYLATCEAFNSNHFINLIIDNDKENKRLMATKGWKFHISLFHEGDNVARGWDIIKKHLIDADVAHFKVIRNSELLKFTKDEIQAGKEITIYSFKENRSVSQWEKLLEDITQDLTTNQIILGPLPPDCFALCGSSYMSYKYDSGKAFKRIKNVKSRTYDNDCPYSEIKIKQSNQFKRSQYTTAIDSKDLNFNDMVSSMDTKEPSQNIDINLGTKENEREFSDIDSKQIFQAVNNTDQKNNPHGFYASKAIEISIKNTSNNKKQFGCLRSCTIN